MIEAPPGFEPGHKSFADFCLTTWLWRLICKTKDAKCVFCFKWSGRRDSNSRRSPWQGDALPLSHSRINAFGWNRTADTGIFSPLLYRLSYKGILATRMRLELTTSSVTGWRSNQLNYRAKGGGSNRARTCDILLVRQTLSQLSYTPKCVPIANKCFVIVSTTEFIITDINTFVNTFFKKN